MFTKSATLLFAAAAALSVSGLSIDTPAELTQCGTVELKWSGKNFPFILSVLPSCESDSEDPLMEFTGVNATSYKWTVNLPSSTGPIAFAVTDKDGNEAYTGEVAIKSSDNAACLSTAPSSAAETASATNAGVASADAERTTVSVSSTAVPTAPVNAGAGFNSGSSSSSEGGSSSSSDNQTQANGAATPVAPVFASMIGAAAAFAILL